MISFQNLLQTYRIGELEGVEVGEFDGEGEMRASTDDIDAKSTKRNGGKCDGGGASF